MLVCLCEGTWTEGQSLLPLTDAVIAVPRPGLSAVGSEGGLLSNDLKDCFSETKVWWDGAEPEGTLPALDVLLGGPELQEASGTVPSRQGAGEQGALPGGRGCGRRVQDRWLSC